VSCHTNVHALWHGRQQSRYSFPDKHGQFVGIAFLALGVSAPNLSCALPREPSCICCSGLQTFVQPVFCKYPDSDCLCHIYATDPWRLPASHRYWQWISDSTAPHSARNPFLAALGSSASRLDPETSDVPSVWRVWIDTMHSVLQRKISSKCKRRKLRSRATESATRGTMAMATMATACYNFPTFLESKSCRFLRILCEVVKHVQFHHQTCQQMCNLHLQIKIYRLNDVSSTFHSCVGPEREEEVGSRRSQPTGLFAEEARTISVLVIQLRT